MHHTYRYVFCYSVTRLKSAMEVVESVVKPLAEMAVANKDAIERDIKESVGEMWSCTLKNQSGQTLIAIGSTSKFGELETPLPDISPGETKSFVWQRQHAKVPGASGIVHFLVGDTGLVLNVMASVPVDFQVNSAWSNARVCYWRESFENLYHGNGGCVKAIKGGNRRTVEGCDFFLTNTPKALLNVTYNYIDRSSRLHVPPSLTSAILDQHYEMQDISHYWICGIVNRSPFTLIADGASAKTEFIGLRTLQTNIEPNQSCLLVWTNHDSDELSGASGVLHYKICSTEPSNTTLSIMAAVLPNQALGNARVGNEKETLENLLHGRNGCGPPAKAGVVVKRDDCDLVLSGLEQATFLIVYKGGGPGPVPEILSQQSKSEYPPPAGKMSKGLNIFSKSKHHDNN